MRACIIMSANDSLTLCVCVDTGDEYLILLPECLPFISELLEDDVSAVTSLTAEVRFHGYMHDFPDIGRCNAGIRVKMCSWSSISRTCQARNWTNTSPNP